MGNKRNNISPPKWPFKLLSYFISSHYQEEIEGDLEERYQDNVELVGTRKANIFYVIDTIKLMRPILMKKKNKMDYQFNHMHIIKHHLTLSLRHFNRHKSTFLINLVGLTSGLASALLIFLWINDELRMDQFDEPDSHRHYQVMVNSKRSSGIVTRDFTPVPLSNAMEKELPEVAYSFPIVEHPFYQGVISFNDKNFRAFPQFVGDGYFKVFTCDFIAGDKEQALVELNHVLISERLANGLFGNSNEAIGKTIGFKGPYFTGSYIVSGVFDDRRNASFTYDLLFSHDQFLTGRPDVNSWENGGTQTHLVLHEDVDLDLFNEKIAHYLKTKMEYNNQRLFAQLYADRYLYGNYENGFPAPGRILYVRMFSLIALVVLLIASINYMNLATAQASKRIKEIGVKKAMGVRRKTLVSQHLGESLVISFLSLIFALGIAMLLLTPFNAITEKNQTIGDIFSATLPILLITLLTGLISSIYPCLYLSNFKPVSALKGKIQSNLGSLWLRKGLVIFQFMISVTLVLAVIVIYKQMDFVSKVNLGYDQDQLVSFRQEGKMRDDFDPFINEVKALPGVKAASYMWGNLGHRLSAGYNLQWKDQDPEERSIEFHFLEGGFDMAELMGVELISGRFLSRDFPSDSSAIVINETTAKLMGHEDPIGQKLWRGEMYTIVGVVKDFHFQGMHETIKPFYFCISRRGENFVLKINTENRVETLTKLEELYAAFNPGYPFDFKFIDDNYQASYEEEERIATLSRYFSLITITISCLGLLALTAFSANARFKEIAIRKVLGSSNYQVAQLLSKDFILLVLIAIIIAIPLGYYLMRHWLDGFAYRIDLKGTYFVITGAAILILSWVTIMTQTAKSAKVDINQTLKAE